MIPGTVIGGRFEIEREAAVGGMGVVYRAVDRFDGTPIAVKVFRGRSALGLERFEREAAVLAELQHPGIVRYIGSGSTDAGDRYIVMEWLEGEDLERRLARRPLRLAESLTILHKAALALAPAHRRGFLHRDLKPANIFLVDGDVERVKMLDFGIARLIHDRDRITRVGVLMGTPGYMAPEQVQSSAPHDARTDVFALGCVLFECITGHLAFDGDDVMAVLAKILLQEVPPLREVRPDVPEAVERLVARMLAKDPDERPRDASELASELDPLLQFLRGSPSIPAPSLVMTQVASAPTLPAISSSQMESALTLSEQRLVSVVLAGAPRAGGGAAAQQREVLAFEQYGGHLRVLADGSMLVTIWGAGSVVDRASRAARCALGLHARYAEVPICVVTGRGVFATRVVEGKLIDRGVSALRATRPGEVRLDAETADMLGARFITEAQGGGFLLRGELPQRETEPSLLGKPTSCVGRNRELSMLDAFLASCMAEPAASVVLVVGPAGAGKSRIEREFRRRLARRDEAVEVLSGRAGSLDERAPFGVIADAIRGASGVQDGEPLELRQQKLTRRLGRHLSGERLARAAVFLGEMTGTPFPDEAYPALRAAREDAQLMGDAMRAAWESWLEAECAAQPVVLVLEDMHWGDAATVRLVDASLRNLSELPLLVLVLARPELYGRFPALWAERGAQVIRLGGLPRKASEQLVREVLGAHASAEVVARIVARADGNPFYLEELMRAVAAGRGDAFPDSVLGVVEARLDAEGMEAKRILRAASVFGERFSTRGLAALLGGEAHLDEADAWLAVLQGRELITQVSVPEGVDDNAYAFRHALVREAVYAMLTEADRALGHRLAGEWLEESGSSDALSMAEHFRRGGEPARAVRWYRRAAEQALAADDLAAALERAERGDACGAAAEELGALRLLMAEAHAWRGEIALAEQRGSEASSLLAPGTVAWFRAVAQVMLAAGKQGKVDLIERWVAQLSGTSPAEGARTAQIICQCVCASQLSFGGRYEAADALLAALDRDLADRPRDDASAVAALEEVRAFRASAAGDFAACLAHLRAALAAFEEKGDRRNACISRSNIGFVLAELGDFAGAEEALRAALATAERMALHTAAAVALHNLGLVLAYRGQIAEARRFEERASAAFHEQSDPRMGGLARAYLAKIELLAGDPVSAEREARAAAETLLAAPPLRAGALAVLARGLLGQGRFAEALEVAREAASLLDSLGSIEEGEALVRLAYAEALLANGEEGGFKAVIGEARERLLARAGKISDPVWRERFLTSVPENVALLERAPHSPLPPSSPLQGDKGGSMGAGGFGGGGVACDGGGLALSPVSPSPSGEGENAHPPTAPRPPGGGLG